MSLAFVCQCSCIGESLYSLVFIKPKLPGTLLEYLLLFKRIPLSTTPCINQAIIYHNLFVVSYSHFLLIISINKIVFSRFVLTDLGHLNAYLLTDLFLLTSTYYLGISSRNTSIPRYLQTLVVGQIVFFWGFSLLALDRMILQVFDINSLYSHLLDCTVHLGDHHPYRWPPSRLLTIFFIYW